MERKPVKRYVLAFLGCVAILTWMASPAQAAGSPVDDATTAFQSAPVYVAPGTEHTNSDTAGVLTAHLKTGDKLVIVMLPASASTGAAGDLTAVAQQIDSATGGTKIIGLAIGDKLLAYSSVLPAGVASDQMNRAISVSTNSSETLSTFIDNIHYWQKRNPNEVAAQDPTPSSGTSPLLIGLPVGVVVAGGAVAWIIRRRMKLQSLSPDDNIRLHDSPEPVKEVLEQILDYRSRISDRNVRDLLTQICGDTENFYERARQRGVNVSEDTPRYTHHLQSLLKVVDRYVDIQDNPRYWDNGDQLMLDGVEAFQGFSTFVIDSIKDGGRSQLTDYHVDTKILAAQSSR
jgi:hypothetical protein